jgi:hypothetical protein
VIKRKYRSFEDTREFAGTLGLRNNAEWRKYCKSGKKPPDIPTNPQTKYKEDGVTMGDFLGTGYVQAQKRKYRTYEETK